MIYAFDDFQLKHLCDVIEAERRVRERLYNELKWTNAWSPGGMTTRQRPRSGRGQKQALKQRPSSARQYDDTSDTSYDRPSSVRESRQKVKEISKRRPKSKALEIRSDTSCDERPRKERPYSARDSHEKVKDNVKGKPKTLAFEIGSESKSVAVKWGTDPRSLSVTMGEGYGRRQRTSRKSEAGHEKFVISNFGKGSSFQVDPGRTRKDPTNITIDNVRRGTSGPKETLRVTGGGTNVVIHNPKQKGTPGGSDTIHVASGEPNIVVHKPRPDENSDSSDSQIIRKKEKRTKKTKKKEIKHTETYNAIQFEENTGTQTAWMDTDPDPAPDKTSGPEFRRVKFMGEERVHREYKTAFIDDRNHVRPMTDEDIPLVVTVTQPDEDEDEDEYDEESHQEPGYRPEVIHYIDKTIPVRALEPFDPVFIQPHPVWQPEPSDRRPTTADRLRSRRPLPTSQRQYRPLDVYDRRSADTNDRFLVVKTRGSPRKPPRSPISYQQYDNSIFTVY